MSHTTDKPLQVPGIVDRGDDREADKLLLLGGAVPVRQDDRLARAPYHHYTGNAIPWFVRGIWIIFWCYAITYVVLWLLPSLQSELLSPP